MAKHLHDRGEAAAALRIAMAVTLLSPGCSEAWLVRAKACRALGDEAGAQEAEAVAGAAAAEPPRLPFKPIVSPMASA